MTRVDKADILDLTVYHLSQLQRQQQSVTMATEAAAYNAGYKACAREAVTYLARNKLTTDTVTGSLNNHLHQTFLTSSRRQEIANNNKHGNDVFNQNRQTHRLSTPLRPCDTLNTSSLPELYLSGYSPILNGSQALPEVTSSFVHASLDSSFSGFSSTSSIETPSSYCTSSDYSQVDDSCSENDEKNTDNLIDVVSIGKGKENEIGHVIKEVPWRPF
jgi:hypothetical protein